MSKIFKKIFFTTILLLLFISNSINGQTQSSSPYGSVVNTATYRDLYISNMILGAEIHQSGTSGDGNYNYYNNLSSATAPIGGVLSGTIEYTKGVTYEKTFVQIWIDFNKDNAFDFSELSTEEFDIVTNNSDTDLTITQAINISIPGTATTGITRMRVIVYNDGNGNTLTPYNVNYRLGDTMDFNVNLVDPNTDPAANCQDISVSLDQSGNATITPSQINNGSTDLEDDLISSPLSYSLDIDTFTCDDLGANTVVLTVTDSSGASDTCSATVTVNAYSGNFIAPVLEDVTAFCEYTPVAPIMNYECGTTITGTTTNTTTTFTSNDVVLWKFDNGVDDPVYANQNIYIVTPSTPTGLSSSNIDERSVDLSWSDSSSGPYKLSYRKTGATSWTEISGISAKNYTLSNLDNGTSYEAKVAVDGTCATYTSAISFTTASIVYCETTSNTSDADFYISNVSLGEIEQSSSNNLPTYVYYDGVSTSVNRSSDLTGSVTYKTLGWGNNYLKIWIDYDQNGVFSTGELVFDEQENGTTVTKSIDITIPNTAVTGKTRMRIMMTNGNVTDPCIFNTQGNVQDYDLYIKPVLAVPTAVCKDLNIELDITGNATITASQINNGSTDDFDNANDLTLSLSKTTFTCNDLGDNTVTLTVTDSDGLSDTCTATVNVSAYSGSFEAPVLETIDAYCSHTATAPVMDYQCGQEITATTGDTTTFNSPGSYVITWAFDNGSTVVYANQTVNVTTPTTPTGFTLSDIEETSVDLEWTSTETGPFKIRYKETSESTWTVINNIATTSTTLTSLNNGTDYDVQVAVDADCADYTSTSNFTTTLVSYCETSNVWVDNGTDYFYIQTVALGTINQSSTNSVSKYNYFDGISTTVSKSNNLTGSITYISPTWTDNYLKIYIDYNIDGDFSDSGELVYDQAGGTGNSSTTEAISIAIPNTALTGKTRMRIYVSNGDKTDPCNMSSQGNVQDYDLYIDPVDTSILESAMITQVYHTDDEKWIEITNQGNVTIPTNTIVLAIYQDKTGDQTGVVPTATYTIATELAQGESALIKSSGASVVSGGTVNSGVTNFNGANDILAVVNVTDATAWANRFDVVSDIADNTTYVRNDEIEAYNNTFTASEWTTFTTDNITEVTNAAATANAKLGVHNFGAASPSESWSNGTPDRSRNVVIDQNYQESSASIIARELSVTGSNKLTITNLPLTVVNGIDINSSAEIRLAGTSQLIQTHTGNKQILGTGKLYIDQNSTVDSKYRFNYMLSPVNNGATSYTVAGVLHDGTIPTSSTSTAVDIDFESGYDGSKTSPITIAEYWIYTYPSSDASAGGYVQSKSSGSIPEANGFTFKGPGVAQNYTYVGIPNDGNITTSIGGDESHLVGNPYPSAISAEEFIEDNEDAIVGTLYFWQHVGEKNATGTAGHSYGGYLGGYATRSKLMGVAADNIASNSNIYTGENPEEGSLYVAPEAYIAVGQGFFIQGDSDGGTVIFKNSQRKYVTEEGEDPESVFFRTADKAGYLTTAKTVTSNTSTSESKTPIIKLGMNYKNDDDLLLHSQIGVSFTEGNTFEEEHGYDSPSFNEGDTRIYWKFPNNDEKYVIAGVQPISDDLEVPLEIVMGYDGELTINIDELQGVDRDVYLKDKETNTVTKINNATATLNLTQNTYSDRFYLTFDNQGALATDHLNMQTLDVQYNEENKSIELSNTNVIEVFTVDIYNMVGVQVKSWDSAQELYSVDSLAPGIYIVKVNTDNGEIKRKVLIK